MAKVKRGAIIGTYATKEEAAAAFDKAYLYLHGNEDNLPKVLSKINFPDAPYCHMPFSELGQEVEQAIARYLISALERCLFAIRWLIQYPPMLILKL